VPFDLAAHPELASVALSLWHLDADPAIDAAKDKKVVFLKAGERDDELSMSGHLDIASATIVAGSHTTDREGGFVDAVNRGGVQSVYRDVRASISHEGFFTGHRQIDVLGGYVHNRGDAGEGFVRAELELDGRTTLDMESLVTRFLKTMDTPFEATPCRVDGRPLLGWVRGECGKAKGDMVVYFTNPAIEALAQDADRGSVRAAFARAADSLGPGLGMSSEHVRGEADKMAALLARLAGAPPKKRLESLAAFTKDLDPRTFWLDVAALKLILEAQGASRAVVVQSGSLVGDRLSIKAKPNAADMPDIEKAIEVATRGIPHLSD
jgi:hypothetical protein